MHSAFPGSVSISNILPLSPLNKKFLTFYLEGMVATIIALPSQYIRHARVTPSYGALIWLVAIKRRTGWSIQGLRPFYGLIKEKNNAFATIINKFWVNKFRTQMNFSLVLEEFFKAKKLLFDGRVHNLEKLKPWGFPTAKLPHAGSQDTSTLTIKVSPFIIWF